MLKKQLVLLNVLILGLCPALQAIDDLYKKIEQEYLTVPEIYDVNVNSLIPDKPTTLDKSKKTQQDVELFNDLSVKTLSPAEQKYLVYSFLHDHQNIPDVLSSDSWDELALYKGNSLVKSLSPFLQTVQGEVVLTKMIALPLVNQEQLQARQALVQKLIDDPKLLTSLDANLKEIAQAEPYYFALLIDHNKERSLINNVTSAVDSIDAKSLEIKTRINQLIYGLVVAWPYLNCFLDGYNLVQSFRAKPKPIKSVQYYVLEFGAHILSDTIEQEDWAGNDTKKLKDALKTYHSLMGMYISPNLVNFLTWIPYFYFFSPKQQYNQFQFTFKTSKYIQAKLMKVAPFVTASHNIYKHICIDSLLQKNALGFDTLDNFFGTLENRSTLLHACSIKRLIMNLESNTFKGDPSFFSQAGKVFASYNLLCHVKQDLSAILETIGSMDVYVAMAKLYKEKQATSTPFCFAQFMSFDKPYLAINNGWNLTQEQEQKDFTSIILDGNEARVAFLPNPDVVEKQTNLETAVHCILMAQVFGIAPAQSMSFTPFARINTCIDCSKSFNTQVTKSEAIMTRIKDLEPNQFSFTVLNKLYSNGNPVATPTLEKAYTESIAQYRNSLVMQTTYNPALLELANQEPAVYKTCKTDIIN